MALRECIFVLRIILNGVAKAPPLKLSTSPGCTPGLFTFQPELATGYKAPMLNRVLQRAAVKISVLIYGDKHSLA